MQTPNHSEAEILQPSHDLNADIAFLAAAGFRLETIYPADNPRVAIVVGHGIKVRLDRDFDGAAAVLRLNVLDPISFVAEANAVQSGTFTTDTAGEPECMAPSGMRIRLQKKQPDLHIPPTVHALTVQRFVDGEPWIIGRAGMHYRDLIPDRLGGSVIASHIRIPEGGPVPDMVHYHVVGFQLIYCYRGWVRLVYEDQGPPFILRAGDCVTQPPRIRHRVLEASDQLEVIEIGVPAEHVTAIDHQLELPTVQIKRDRVFDGQTFCHHLCDEAEWGAWRIDGFESRDTGVARHSGQVASVQVARPTNDLPAGTAQDLKHTADIQFCFVTEGQMTLDVDGEKRDLAAGDAFVLPPSVSAVLGNPSKDLELLEVTLPAQSD